MRKALERIERYIRGCLRTRRTRRIEVDREHYLKDYQEVQAYLHRLHDAAARQESVVTALQKRMGL